MRAVSVPPKDVIVTMFESPRYLRELMSLGTSAYLLGSSLPTGYAPDPSDPEVLLLVRPDGTTVALFSARGVTAEGVLEAAGPDRGLRTHEEPLGEP